MIKVKTPQVRFLRMNLNQYKIIALSMSLEITIESRLNHTTSRIINEDKLIRNYNKNIDINETQNTLYLYKRP